MLKETRHQKILDILETEKEIHTADLAKRFGVTEMTIRRDIDTIAKNHAIIKTRGGAYLAPAAQMGAPSFDVRKKEARGAKDAIAARAAAIAVDCPNIFIDAGTTTEWILRHLNRNRPYMIITNGLNVALESINYSNLSTFLIGGELHSNTLTTAGSIAEEALKMFNYDIAFLGANAIDNRGNAYVGVTSEVILKRRVIENSRKCYVLADSSKFSNYSLTKFCNLRDIDGLITDRGLDSDIEERFRNQDVNIIFSD